MCNTRFCKGEVIRVFNLITRKKNIEHLRFLIKGRTNDTIYKRLTKSANSGNETMENTLQL
jgi:hypothetical protein